MNEKETVVSTLRHCPHCGEKILIRTIVKSAEPEVTALVEKVLGTA